MAIFHQRAAMVLFVVVSATKVIAQPSLSVTSLGLNDSGHRNWRVNVTPDAARFSQTPEGLGGSLATEIGFTLEGSHLVSAIKNASIWPFDNPGHNPFSGDITEGVSLGEDRLSFFIALGSNVLLGPDAVELLTLVTEGAGATTLSWGGQTLLEGTPFEFVGARVAQGGRNFDGITGSITSGQGGPLDCSGDGVVDVVDLDCSNEADTTADLLTQLGLLAGDLDGQGGVAFSDFLILSSNFGRPLSKYTEGDIDGNGNVSFADFLILSANFGALAPEQGVGATAAIPEPTALVPVVLGGILMALALRRRNQ